MLDVDKSGDISADDLLEFHKNCMKCKETATGTKQNINKLDKARAEEIIYNLDLKRHKAITPDQFLNIVMAAYE